MAPMDVLPWRIRDRVRPPGFVSPRARHRARTRPEGHDARSERVPFNRIQQRAGVALLASTQTSAHALSAIAVDYSRLAEIRVESGPAFREQEGFGLTYLPMVAVAVCRALHAHRTLNATISGDGDDLTVVEHSRVHLGIAVDLDHAGLVVPVVRDADGLSVRGMARAIRDLATRARTKKLQPDDVTGATFTITNPGGYGTEISVPIINQPQVAILSTDGVRKRVVVDPATGQLTIRPMGYLCASFDQRAVDAVSAATLLATVKALIEDRREMRIAT